MTDRATLFAHEKCSPAEAVHPIQPLLRGAVFPATPPANACLGDPVGSAKQRLPSRQPRRFGTGPKRALTAPGAGLPETQAPRAQDCTGPQAPGRRTRKAPRPVTL